MPFANISGYETGVHVIFHGNVWQTACEKQQQQQPLHIKHTILLGRMLVVDFLMHVHDSLCTCLREINCVKQDHKSISLPILVLYSNLSIYALINVQAANFYLFTEKFTDRRRVKAKKKLYKAFT